MAEQIAGSVISQSMICNQFAQQIENEKLILEETIEYLDYWVGFYHNIDIVKADDYSYISLVNSTDMQGLEIVRGSFEQNLNASQNGCFKINDDKDMAGIIEKEEGIKACGNEEIYNNVLKEFVTMYQKTRAELDEIFEHKDIRNYTIKLLMFLHD